ncbi:LacI family DNA-binding transcriptional regulator [Microbacteriaceae bacterium VKM Ac-2855]|nr:LacI family DNA-binding transcriptional regulator [Microbacteriaceae bacterium VKM Ac-2855]
MPDVAHHRKAPTRNDVAELAQVSTAVVSYVLTGAKRVTPDKERRVREAIAELGYRPNSSARALRTGRSHVLALLIPDSANPYFAEYALQIEIVASERGYALLIANTHDDHEREARLMNEMHSRGVDGLILASVFHDSWPTPSATEVPIPTVLIDSFHMVETVPTIGVDAVASAHTVVRHLIEVHGCRSIALVLGPSADPTGAPDLRAVGWEQALSAAGLPHDDALITSWSREGGIAAAQQLFARPDRPDAVFAGSDLIGIGLLRGAADLGLRVPEDLAIISYDGTSESAFSIPRLTTLQQPVALMARAAIDTVLTPTATTAASAHRAKHVAFRGELILRESCGCGSPRARGTTAPPKGTSQ